MTTLIPKFDLKDGGATPAGAVNRTIFEKLSDVVSVKDFGAVGDGITDDSTAIQAALTVGGDIYFPQSTGAYIVGTTLNISANTSLIFADNATLKAKSTLTGPMLSASAVSNVKITNGIIDGNGSVASSSTFPIYLYNCSKVWVSNCTVKNGKSVNIRIEGPSSSSVSSDICVNNCLITASLSVGITPTYSSNILIENNIVSSNVTGLTSGECTNMTIVGNTFHDNDNDGCAVGNNCAYVTIVGNISSNNGAEGINVDGVNHGVIVGNSSFNNLIGITVWSRSPGTALAGRNLVSGNTVSTCTQFGILVADQQSNCIVNGNSVDSCGDQGIYVIECQFALISNNIVNSNAESGIYVAGGIGARIDGNYVSQNGGYGIELVSGTGTGRVTVNNNTLHSNNVYGVYDNTNGSANVISNNEFNDEDGTPSQTNSIYVNDNNVNINNNRNLNGTTGYPVIAGGSAHQSNNSWQTNSAAPTTGTWAVNDIVYNSAPASAGYIGWVCTVAGTPGTWKTFGLIS